MIYEDLSGQLPSKQDKELLKTLLVALREGGKDLVAEKLEEIIADLTEDQ